MNSIFLLLFWVQFVYGIGNDTCQCCAKLEALEQKDQMLEERVAVLENLLGVTAAGESNNEYVLVTAGSGTGGGGGPPGSMDDSAKLSVINLKSDSFYCDIRINTDIPGAEFVKGAGGFLSSNDTLVLCGMSYPRRNEPSSPTCMRMDTQRNSGWEKNFEYLPGSSAIYGGFVNLDDRLLISGGNKQGSFQIVTADEQFEGPKMPKFALGHCTVKLNEHMIMVIGGAAGKVGDWEVLSETHIYCTRSETWTAGPKLNTPRAMHGCATFNGPDGQQVVAVIGGEEKLVPGKGGLVDTVEFLDMDQSPRRWTPGPMLPKKLSNFATVSSKDQTSVYTMGGICNDCSEWDSLRDQILKLSCENTLADCQWTTMDTKLQYKTYDHIAFQIPDRMAKKLCRI